MILTQGMYVIGVNTNQMYKIIQINGNQLSMTQTNTGSIVYTQKESVRPYAYQPGNEVILRGTRSFVVNHMYYDNVSKQVRVSLLRISSHVTVGYSLEQLGSDFLKFD